MRRPVPLFLERASYRRRRLGDAARVLPVLALVAVLLPVWLMPGAAGSPAGMVALFSGWAALIAAIAALHRALLRADAPTRRAGQAVDAALAIEATQPPPAPLPGPDAGPAHSHGPDDEL